MLFFVGTPQILYLSSVASSVEFELKDMTERNTSVSVFTIVSRERRVLSNPPQRDRVLNPVQSD